MFLPFYLNAKINCCLQICQICSFGTTIELIKQKNMDDFAKMLANIDLSVFVLRSRV